MGNVPGVFELFFTWKLEIYLYTSRIMVPVYLRLTVFVKDPGGIHVHNGPGMDSDQVNHNCSVCHFSSFHTFIVVFTTTWSNKYEMYPSEFGLNYTGRYVRATKATYNSQTLKLPTCTVLREINTKLHKMPDVREGNFHWKFHGKFPLCL